MSRLVGGTAGQWCDPPPRSGRPRLRPRRVAGDKGYSSPTARNRLRRRHIRPVIPSKSNQRRQPRFDRDAYRQRNRIERLINHLKQFRRIATRYEKRGINYLAMVMLGMILLFGYSQRLQTRPRGSRIMQTASERAHDPRQRVTR